MLRQRFALRYEKEIQAKRQMSGVMKRMKRDRDLRMRHVSFEKMGNQERKYKDEEE